MQDILGRELHDGDIVVTKGNQATGTKRSMAVGIFRGKSVRIQGGKWRTASDMFLVENPTPVELGIKEIILREIELEKAEAAMHQKKTAHQIADEPGQLYVFSDNTVYLYCGYWHYDKMHRGNREIGNGHIYFPLWHIDCPSTSPENFCGIDWKGIETFIRLKRSTAVIFCKVLKNPGKYKKIYPMSAKAEIPERMEFECFAVDFKIKFFHA